MTSPWWGKLAKTGKIPGKKAQIFILPISSSR